MYVCRKAAVIFVCSFSFSCIDLDVRNAAISSIGSLLLTLFDDAADEERDDDEAEASRSQVLQRAQDQLMEAVNDEVDAVRLNAVLTVHALTRHAPQQLRLRQDQLEVLLEACKEAAGVLRGAIRALLEDALLSTADCLRDVLRALLLNLRLYPQDRASIWQYATATAIVNAPRHTDLLRTCIPLIVHILSQLQYSGIV